MKTMKILSILTIIIGFSQCGTTKFAKNPPFKIESATYTNWVGGVPGVSGTRVEVRLSEKEPIVFDSLYFQKKRTKIEVSIQNKIMILIGHFSTSNRKENHLILHSNTKMELKNKVPKATKFPFNLKENEAIISYKVANKVKYFKIENIKEGKRNHYPKAR